MSSTTTARHTALAHVEHPVFGSIGGLVQPDSTVALFSSHDEARRAQGDTGAAHETRPIDGLRVQVAARDLLPGTAFLTPGGATVETVKVRPASQSDYGYVDVYLASPNDSITLHGLRLVELVTR